MVGLTACGSSMKSQRITSDEADAIASDITDDWVKKDTKMAIASLTKQMQESKGLSKYLGNNDKQPKIFVGEIQNNTSEPYLPIQDMEEKLQEMLLKGGDFKLVDTANREAILKEITFQNDGMVDSKQAKRIGRQSGADLAIFGSINMTPKTLEGKTIKNYSANFRITELETSDIIWMGSYDVSKYSERSSSKW